MSKNEVEKQLIYEKFEKLLPEIIAKADDYSELYGYDLKQLVNSDGEDGKVILECLLRKYLQANNYDIEGAKNQLLKSLKWRKSFNPLSAAFLESHDPELEKLGKVTNEKGIVTTWNLYGAVKNREQLFGDLNGFLRWRVGIMEQGISLLNFTKQAESSMIQVHDYFDVSFFRLDANTKAATKETIQLLQDHYPESLRSKYFVNVPTIMGWVFSFVKPFLSRETVAKFNVLSNGKGLAKDIGNWVPKVYGGDGGETLDDINIKEFKPRDDSLVKKWEGNVKKEKVVAGTKSEGNGVASSTSTAPPPIPGSVPVPPPTVTTKVAKIEDEVKEVAVPQPGSVPELSNAAQEVEAVAAKASAGVATDESNIVAEAKEQITDAPESAQAIEPTKAASINGATTENSEIKTEAIETTTPTSVPATTTSSA